MFPGLHFFNNNLTVYTLFLFFRKTKNVAFTVCPFPGRNVGSNTILPFNREYINECGGYHVSNKKIHCPKSCLYLFSLSVETSCLHLDVHLMKNGKENGILLKGTNGNI